MEKQKQTKLEKWIEKMMGYGLATMFALILATTFVMAATTGTVATPADSAVISGGTYNVTYNFTAVNAGEEVGNVTFGYQCAANSTFTTIGTTGNSTDNQTSFGFSWDTTAIEDCTLQLRGQAFNHTVGATTTTEVSTDTNTGVVSNNTAMSLTLTNPSDNTRQVNNGSVYFRATTSEEISSLSLKFNGKTYTLTGDTAGKAWTTTVNNIPDASYTWDVSGTDQAGGNAIDAGADFRFSLDDTGGGLVQAVEQQKQQDKQGSNQKLFWVAIAVVVLVIAYFSDKK